MIKNSGLSHLKGRKCSASVARVRSKKLSLRSTSFVAWILLSVVATSTRAALPYSLGQAGSYAVLGLGGISSAHGQIEVYQSATVVNGNVGAGPYADWTHGIDATINGRVDYDTTDSAPTVTGSVTGGLHQISMSGPVTDARNASALYA